MYRSRVLLVLVCLSLGYPTGAAGRSRAFQLAARAVPGAQASSAPLVQEGAYLKAPDPRRADLFGDSVSVSGNTLAIGASGDSRAAQLGGSVYVLVREGPSWSHQARLESPALEPLGRFGRSVALSGDTLAVGAGDNGALAGEGVVYVFVRSGTSWSLQAALLPSVLNAERFGFSVALDGDTIVAGAYQETGFTVRGAAYVFVRNGTSWSQQARLEASNAEIYDGFGYAVAVSGDTLVVSATGEDSAATGVNGDQTSNAAGGSGAAYVFRRSGVHWSQEAYLKASNTQSADAFGGSVALAGETLVVGAITEDSAATGVNGNHSDNSAGSSGAVYVFVRDGSSWSQEAYLKASNTGANDNFGSSVDVAGDTVLVGATGEDSAATGVNGDESDNSLSSSGAAYQFHRDGASWCQGAYLKATFPGATDFFGGSVAAGDDTLLVGAPVEDAVALESGAAYAFDLGVLAAVAFRNAGSNPASYAASAIETPGTFTATVDNNLAAQVASLLFAYDTALSLTLGTGQTLLCLDLGGSGELFTGSNLAPTSSALGVDSYSLAVPDLPALLGFAFSSQAIQFGSPPFALSNALDFTIGGL